MFSQVKTPLRGRPGNGLPSLSPMCAQARARFTQVIHTVMHSNPIRTGVLTVLCGFGGLTESGLAVVVDPAWNNGGYLRLLFSLLDLEQLPLRTRLDPGTDVPTVMTTRASGKHPAIGTRTQRCVTQRCHAALFLLHVLLQRPARKGPLPAGKGP